MGKTDGGRSGQLDRLREAARKARADESEDAFKARLRKIAKARVQDEKPPGPNDTPDDEKPGR